MASTSNLGTGAAGGYGYAAGSGTSFAAPVVAGVAALMWSVNPALGVAEIETGLRATSRPHVQVPILQACNAASGNKAGRCQCDTSICGAGILDADQALAFAASPSGWVAPTRAAVSLDTPEIRQCARSLGLPVPADPAPPPAPGAGSGGGGGGAVGIEWLAALLLATCLLCVRRKD
jgi:serine protease